MSEAPLFVVDHPLARHRLRGLRDVATDTETFSRLLGELSAMVAYEALRDLRTKASSVVTPVATDTSALLVDEPVVLVPILRAGLGMIPAIQALVPTSVVAHVGIRRDEATLLPAVYLDALPADLSGCRVVVCDPMLATGGSLACACDMVASRGAASITALCIIASVTGLEAFRSRHGAVAVACVVVDPVLDANGYIVPGLGDAGDRQFGLQE